MGANVYHREEVQEAKPIQLHLLENNKNKKPIQWKVSLLAGYFCSKVYFQFILSQQLDQTSKHHLRSCVLAIRLTPTN